MGPDLDLRHRAWTKTRGSITAIGTWIRLDGQFRPCMVLIPAGREQDERLMPCVVTMDRAWMWAEETGDPAQTIPILAQFMDCLGLSLHDRRTAFGLLSFIRDMLGDLLAIPPYQPDESGPVVAEVTLIDHGSGRTVETELKDV